MRSTRLQIIAAFFVLVGTVFLAAQLRAQAPATQPAGASGTWRYTVEGFGGQQEVVLKLKQDGEKLTGTISGMGGEDSAISAGTVKGSEISFKVVRDFGGTPLTTIYTGKLSGDSFKGKSETIIAQDFEAKRAP